MELEVFAGQEKSELSMIEVARAILELRGRDNEMHFSDLVNEIQNYLEKPNSEIREALPLFYTELNFDGSFISLGDNKWGLRSWYGVDEIDEEIIALEETDEDDDAPKKPKKQRVNAFMDGDSDAIDYNADDPEDEDAYEADPALNYDEENPDDEKSEVEAYDAEINEIAPDDLGEEVELNEEDDEDDDEDLED